MIYNKFMDTQSFQTEAKRKLFHLTGLVYVAGFLFIPHFTLLIVLILLLCAEATTEILRLKHQNIRNWSHRILGDLLRDHERDKLSGAFWMTLGALGTAVVLPEPRLGATCMLYLIFGDAAASLTGKLLQGPAWYKSPKRISGSVACFIACVLSGLVMLPPDLGWDFVLIGAFTATFFELHSWKINDNFLIPFASAIGFFLTSLL